MFKEKIIKCYLVIILILASYVIWSSLPIYVSITNKDKMNLLLVIALYTFSHTFRVIRLVFLTLDQRSQALPLVLVHVLTSLPSSLLPFKLGEFLRLSAFIHIYKSKMKGIAVWLTERLSDILILALFIYFLYLTGI